MLKLDLGAGAVSPEGFTPRGNAHGTAIFPLSDADGSVDEIRASHVLEHFPHGELPAVLADWVRALKPGGRLRIAVPDFAAIAERYLAGERQPTEGFVMGGQAAPDDFHCSLFDVARLKGLMSAAGLLLIRDWKSELEDCAALPISLNLEGTKPHRSDYRCAAVMSTPRLGFMDNLFCAQEALPRLRITLRRQEGAFWGQCLTAAIEQAIAEENPDFILTLDYDTVFRKEEVAALLATMLCHPEVDALAPVQSSRHVETALFSVRDEKGANRPTILAEELARDLLPVSTAHFGLTVLRVDALRKLPQPWFHSIPAPDGSWGAGHVDEDIAFWRKWTAAGLTLCLAPRIVVGHMELMVRWPGPQLEAIHQPVKEWRHSGAPKETWR